MSNARYIPKYLDAQPQFLWFELDEAMILLMGLVTGRMLDQMIVFIVISFAIQKVYSRLKNAKQTGFVQHTLYALGLVKFKSNLGKFKKIPDYYIKFYVK